MAIGFLSVWLLLASLGFAQPPHSEAIVLTPPAPYSAADAADNLDKFRHSFVPGGDFCLKFDLIHRLRHGDTETRYTGVAWCALSAQGPVTRFRLTATMADKSAKPAVWEWLAQNGATPQLWVLAPGDTAAHELPPEKWREPLFPGMIYTPFDLLMPFLFWPDFSYHGADRVMGSAVDLYTMNAPTAEKANGIAAVRLTIDRELSALKIAEQLDAKGTLVRRFELNEFAKVQEQYMVKSADLMDLASRDYDLFQVTRAVMKLKLDPVIFSPAKLATPAPEPPAAAWADL